MVVKGALAIGSLIIAFLLTAGLVLAQTPTPTASPTATPSPTMFPSPTASPRMPTGAPATGMAAY